VTQIRLDLPTVGRPVSLREQIAATLRGSIVSGQMEQGVTYSVPTLAQRFGVSATPVREAMLDLVKEGLVEPIRNKGFRIVVASDQDLDEVTQLRQLIEPPTVGRVATFISPDALARLRAMAEEICRHAAVGDIISYLEADRVFHLEILSLAGNRRLVENVNLLRAQTRLYGLSRLAEEGQLVASAAEHGDLLDALAAHDAKRAEQLTRHHIGHVRGLWANRPEPVGGSID
jgi:DNA-binding GntR family transcriptional regulator